MRRDKPTFKANDPIRSQCPQPACLIANDVPDPADYVSLNRKTPRNKPDTVEPVDIATRRQKPEETIGRLRNRVHAGGRGAILYPPRRTRVLGQPFVRIEGVSRGLPQQCACEIGAK
jgi:hypothetical protein